MVVGKASRKSNEMVALLSKHSCWKNQQKVQRNCYSASETWSLEKSAESPTKQLLSSRNMVVGKISKNSYETVALLSKHGRWKNKRKVQRNFNFAPETLLEISAIGPKKRLLWYWNMVIGKHHQNVQWNGHFAPKLHSLKVTKTRELLCCQSLRNYEKNFVEENYSSLGNLMKSPMQPTFIPKTHFGKKTYLLLEKLVKSPTQPTFFPKTHFRKKIYLSFRKLVKSPTQPTFFPTTYFGKKNYLSLGKVQHSQLSSRKLISER